MNDIYKMIHDVATQVINGDKAEDLSNRRKGCASVLKDVERIMAERKLTPEEFINLYIMKLHELK